MKEEQNQQPPIFLENRQACIDQRRDAVREHAKSTYIHDTSKAPLFIREKRWLPKGRYIGWGALGLGACIKWISVYLHFRVPGSIWFSLDGVAFSFDIAVLIAGMLVILFTSFAVIMWILLNFNDILDAISSWFDNIFDL